MKGGEGMREIKYRAWDIKTESMRDVLVLDWANGLIDLSGGIIERRPHEVILMQYTGLKDKNGVEICEGDIVETVYNGEVFAGVVVYDLSEVDFKVTDGKEKYGRNFQYLAGNDENEVIGNIYETPELLATKKD